jgi:inositol hexakisphosphate/diphosphoinositol-pentakisphosphate kinase
MTAHARFENSFEQCYRTPKQKLKLDMSHPLILQYFHSHSKNCTKELKVKAKAPLTEFLDTIKKILVETKEQEDADSLRYQLMHMRDILERWKIVGLNRKLQIKPRKFEDVIDAETGETKQLCTEVQLILKWGGNLTKLGEKQAVQLGHRHRHDLYPDAPGGGESHTFTQISCFLCTI